MHKDLCRTHLNACLFKLGYDFSDFALWSPQFLTEGTCSSWLRVLVHHDRKGHPCSSDHGDWGVWLGLPTSQWTRKQRVRPEPQSGLQLSKVSPQRPRSARWAPPSERVTASQDNATYWGMRVQSRSLRGTFQTHANFHWSKL